MFLEVSFTSSGKPSLALLPTKPPAFVQQTFCVSRTHHARLTMELIICNNLLTSLHKLHKGRKHTCFDHGCFHPRHVARCLEKTGAWEMTDDGQPDSWTDLTSTEFLTASYRWMG